MLALLASGLLGVGCKGQIYDGGDFGEQPTAPGDPGAPAPTFPPVGPGPVAMPPAVPPPPPSDDGVFFSTAVRRLTRAELRQTLLDMTGLDLATELAKFPEDFAEAGDVFAFDNKYAHQQPSAALIEAAKNLADKVGAAVLSDPAVRTRLLPCTPTGPGDEACLRKFFERFGRHALRRPLGSDEIDRFVTALRPFAIESNDFNRAVHLGVRALLQDLEFLYRQEIGAPVMGRPGLFKLTGPEVAGRLAYLIWGTAPDDALLAASLTGDQLGSSASIKSTAERMLADPRAKRGILRFHALWLGWERQPPPAAMSGAMLGETAALIEKVIFTDRGSWLDLFRARQTYVDAALAAHYGLPAPAGGMGWVDYGASGRQGILSHATFLGVERKHSDTSPTMRGNFIRTRLLCQTVPPPPAELMIDIDAVPTEGNCKSDRYAMWQREGCKGCHMMMDPIGHGLENYDRVGKRREIAPADAGKAGCEIKGAGEMAGMPNSGFSGVAGLSDRLVESGTLEACAATQLGSFMLGRGPQTGPETELFARVGQRFSRGGHKFADLVLDVVSLPGFGYRQAE